ncbi:MAG TPA: 1-acyl-sn-glycerol-3-phosphate acyltransferase [Candidatus Moranbacteria bacterium]|nr:1-acyl-sn-glycerol-3-phosphate acyltransferase [Candidatus Moranbacteria bacterium]
MLYYILWLVLRPFIELFVKVEGRENIPNCGPVIVVSNHIHDLDPYFIGPFLPFSMPVRWFSKKELYDIRALRDEYSPKVNSRLLGWILAWITVLMVKHSLTIPVDREDAKSKMNKSTIKKALTFLKKRKRVIGIFGEGGIGRKGEVQPIFVSLAKTTGAPILPVKVEKRSTLKLNISFGELITVNRKDGDNQEIAENIMKKIYEM